MFRMMARRDGALSVGSNNDDVIFGITLPSETVIHDISANIRINSPVDRAINEVIAYALEMWILPVFDPDTATTYDALMNTLVPKDTDVQTIDLDTAAVDTTPFWEPGEADWSKVLEIGFQPERLWHEHRYMSFSTPGIHIHQDNQTPFATVWNARAVETIHIKRRLRVEGPSVLVLGMSAPALDDHVSTMDAPLLENEWSRVKYGEQMLEQAHMDLIGLIEATAETPWEDATDLLQKHVRPDLFEETADTFTTSGYDVSYDALIDHSVVGRLGKHTLSLS